MKVGILSPINLANPNLTKVGGGTWYTMNLFNHLIERCNQVDLIGWAPIGSKIKNKNFKPVFINSKSISAYRYILNLIMHKRGINFHKYNIIHAQRPDYLLPLVLIKPRAKLVCTLHGNINRAIHFKHNKAISRIYDFFESFILKKTDAVIAVDSETKEYYIKKYPCIKNKIFVIRTGIDLKLFKPKDRKILRQKYSFDLSEKIISYIGRLECEKNIPLLIQAYQTVKRSLEKSKLIIVGEGRLEQELRETSKSSDILFFGKVNHESIPEILSISDVLVLPSLYEGSPTILIEAMACGTPILATDVGDIKKIITSNKIGYLFHLDPNDLAEKIKLCLSEDLEETKLFRIKESKKYDFNGIIDDIMQVYASGEK